MAARALKSTLSFGLVSCPIALFRTAGEADKPPAWDMDPEPPAKATMTTETKPAREDPLAEEPPTPAVRLAETEVAKPRKGLRREDGTFIDFTDEIDAIAEHTKLEEMRVADFIRTEEVRRGRVLGSYYLAPDGPGAAKVIRLLHEAMRETKRVAVVKFTKRSKQSLAVLIPLAESKSLEVIEMAWAEDLREVPVKCESCAAIPVSEEEINLAVDLVNAMSSTRADALDTLTDDARQMRRDLIAKAEAGETFTVAARPETQEGGEVIELIRRGLDDRDALAAAAA